MRVAIVAGEKSGDYLAAELIKTIRHTHPHAEFVGICGPLMQAEGGVTLADMEKLSIFGLDGLFSSLREIIAIRRKLRKHFMAWQPDVFIGVDVPDFNLGLAGKLKKAGIPTVHFVSPTVWAWRGGRINKIRRSIDLMLTLFPFEKLYYQQRNVSVAYVGHPLAGEVLRWQVNVDLQSRLCRPGRRLIALLPGSRHSEISRLAGPMLDGASQLLAEFDELHFVLPAASHQIYESLQARSDLPADRFTLLDGHSRDVLSLCELAVLASGTAALEAALFAKPMVVMYRVSRLSALVYKRTIQVEHFSMPNHLTPSPVVPELIQEEATAANLVREVAHLLNDRAHYNSIQQELAAIAPALNLNTGQAAATAITELLETYKR